MQSFLEDARAKGAELALNTQVTGGQLSGIDPSAGLLQGSLLFLRPSLQRCPSRSCDTREHCKIKIVIRLINVNRSILISLMGLSGRKQEARATSKS